MSESITIDLGEVLDISSAASFYSQLKDNISNDSNVIFNSGDLVRIDASCLQVLLAFMVYAQENNITVSWDNPTDALVDSARLLGISEKLNITA